MLSSNLKTLPKSEYNAIKKELKEFKKSAEWKAVPLTTRMIMPFKGLLAKRRVGLWNSALSVLSTNEEGGCVVWDESIKDFRFLREKFINMYADAAEMGGINGGRWLPYAQWFLPGDWRKHMFTPYLYDEKKGRWDLDKWNPTYFRILNEMVDLANKMNISPCYNVLDICGTHKNQMGLEANPWLFNIQSILHYQDGPKKFSTEILDNQIKITIRDRGYFKKLKPKNKIADGVWAMEGYNHIWTMLSQNYQYTFDKNLFPTIKHCRAFLEKERQLTNSWFYVEKLFNKVLTELKGKDMYYEFCNEFDWFGVDEAVKFSVKCCELLKKYNIPAHRLSYGACVEGLYYLGNHDKMEERYDRKRKPNGNRRPHTYMLQELMKASRNWGREDLYGEVGKFDILRPGHGCGFKNLEIERPFGFSVDFITRAFKWLSKLISDDGVYHDRPGCDARYWADGKKRPGPDVWRPMVKYVLSRHSFHTGATVVFEHLPKVVAKSCQGPTWKAIAEGFKDAMGHFPKNYGKNINRSKLIGNVEPLKDVVETCHDETCIVVKRATFDVLGKPILVDTGNVCPDKPVDPIDPEPEKKCSCWYWLSFKHGLNFKRFFSCLFGKGDKKCK